MDSLKTECLQPNYWCRHQKASLLKHRKCDKKDLTKHTCRFEAELC